MGRKLDCMMLTGVSYNQASGRQLHCVAAYLAFQPGIVHRTGNIYYTIMSHFFAKTTNVLPIYNLK